MLAPHNPTDRPLADEEWADVAKELMHQTGIPGDGHRVLVS